MHEQTINTHNQAQEQERGPEPNNTCLDILFAGVILASALWAGFMISYMISHFLEGQYHLPSPKGWFS